jgi:hypothetical protein
MTMTAQWNDRSGEADVSVCQCHVLRPCAHAARIHRCGQSTPPNAAKIHNANSYSARRFLIFYTVFNMALATKTQSQNIFTKLKQKPANKVCSLNREGRSIGVNNMCRYVSTAAQRTQHGAQYPLASIYASIAPPTIVTWVSTSRSCDRPISTVRCPSTLGSSRVGIGADTGHSLAMGSTAHLQNGRQRERNQILSITRRFRSARIQGPQGQIHQQCGYQVQGGVNKAMCCGC